MAWTYDPNVFTPKDEVRIRIGDVVSSRPLLDDEEIMYFLKRSGGDYNRAAALAADAIADRLSADPDFAVGGWRESRSEVIERYRQIAARYRALAGGPILVSSREAYFEIGMTDYKEGDGL